MYNKMFIVFILVFVLPFLVFGSAQEPQARLETVYEKTFDEEIVDVVFAEDEVKVKDAKFLGWKGLADKRDNESTTILYPKVLIVKYKEAGRKLIFSNRYGDRVKTYTFPQKTTEVVVSSNEKYIGVTVPTKWSRGEHESIFKMFDSEGNLLWEIEGLGTGPYVPSTDGRLAVGEGSIEYGRAPVAFYDKNGLVKTIKKELSGFWVSFSQSCKYIAIGIPRLPRILGKIVLIDDKFNEIWVDTNAVVGGYLGIQSYIGFSPNEKYILYPVVGDRSKIFDNLLKISTLQGHAVMKVANFKCNPEYVFSKDGNKVLTLSLRDSLYFIDIQEKKVIWNINKWKSLKKPAISTTKNMDKIIIASGLENYIYIIDENGNLLKKENVKLFIGDDRPILTITDDGKKFMILEEGGKIEGFSIKGREE